jgi:DNA-3-methyladenine glycosylase II
MNWSYDVAYKTLKTDPVMDAIIKVTGKLDPVKEKDLYTSLLISIVSQQLSVKAADTIWNRVLQLFPDRQADARLLLSISDEQLRSCGLSYAKAGYLKNVARFQQENSLDYTQLKNKTEEELINHLASIKGVGRWTAEMILIFNLHRRDVMPYDDIGIQNSIRDIYGLSEDKKQLKEEIKLLDRFWQPYRSLACRHLWQIRDSI